jgi:hypothetical protein
MVNVLYNEKKYCDHCTIDSNPWMQNPNIPGWDHGKQDPGAGVVIG